MIVRHTSKNLQQMLEDFSSASDHLGTSCIKSSCAFFLCITDLRLVKKMEVFKPFLNSDSHHTRLNNHHRAQSYKKKKMEKRKAYWKADQRNPKIKSAFTLYLKTHCAGSESFSGNGNVFINDEKCFLFSLNSSFYPFFH